MPALPTPVDLLENILVYRDTTNTSTSVPAQQHLEVVCAWPLSGQYGPGTRVLYYALVAACVFARRTSWVREACLAAVLLFPAVGALHGIALAALHRSGAVDMDVYGAFQLCAIGVLIAPVGVRLSKTYFESQGRDIIFLWTGLLLAGLLSLTVEFYRLEPTICPPDSTENFPYNSNCNMICGDKGPFSPLRKGASDNIYIIPAPNELTFGTATLLAAACCIPAILSLVSTWIKILESNWQNGREQTADGVKPEQQPIEGTNGATPQLMSGVAERIRKGLTMVEIPVVGGAVLAILVKGEMNFFSAPVQYQTEPMSSVGQFSPIVGTALAIVGSLYLRIAAEMEAARKADMEAQADGEGDEGGTPTEQPTTTTTTAAIQRCPRCETCAISDGEGSSSSIRSRSRHSSRDQASTEITRSTTHPSVTRTVNRTNTTQTNQTTDTRSSRKVARLLNTASKELSRKLHEQIEETGFSGLREWPETPGERYRNKNLPDVQKAFSSTPLTRSRAHSFVGSIHSDSPNENGEASSRTPQGQSRLLSLPISRAPRAVTRQRHANTFSSGSSSFEERGRPTLAVLGDCTPGPSRSPSREPVSSEERVSRTPSIPEVSPTDMTFDRDEQDTGTSPKIVVSTP